MKNGLGTKLCDDFAAVAVCVWERREKNFTSIHKSERQATSDPPDTTIHKQKERKAEFRLNHVMFMLYFAAKMIYQYRSKKSHF